MSKKISCSFQPAGTAHARIELVWRGRLRRLPKRPRKQRPRHRRAAPTSLRPRKRPPQPKHLSHTHPMSKPSSPLLFLKMPHGAMEHHLTSKDVVGTWDILWMRQSATWDSLVRCRRQG